MIIRMLFQMSLTKDVEKGNNILKRRARGIKNLEDVK